MSGIDPTVARRAMAVVNNPWRIEGIDDVEERKMMRRMESNLSDLYSVYHMIFDYRIINENGRYYAESVAELGVRTAKRKSVSLGMIGSASIVDGYLDLYVTDSEGNETVIRMKLRCD